MTLNPGTLNLNTPSGNPSTPLPETPPGQQSGSQGTGGTQTPPSTPATGQGSQPGSPEGDNNTQIHLSKTDLENRVAKAKRSGVREMLSALGFENLDNPDKLKQAQSDLGNMLTFARELLSALSPEGLDDPDSLKQAQSDLRDLLAFAREQQTAQMTAEEKVQQEITTLQDQISTLKRRNNKLQADLDAARSAQASVESELSDHKRSTAIIAAAQGANHPADVVIWAKTYQPDLFDSVLKDDGTPSEAAAKRIVEACKKARPEYFGRVTLGSPPNLGAKPPSGTQLPNDKQGQGTGTTRW